MELRSRLARAARSALDLLAPLCCSVCQTPLADDFDLFCEGCAPRACPTNASLQNRLDPEGELGSFSEGVRLSLEEAPVIAVGHYVPPLSIALRRFKYSGRSDLARPLALRMWAASREHLFAEPAAIVPVPLHSKRLAERGYNQSALLARELAKLESFPFLPRALERLRDTPKQATLERAERIVNLEGAISSRRQSIDLPVVLVDDVLTTGATVKQCIAAFNDRGVAVRGVCVVSVTAT